jgi:anti-sigma-K factor RskA
MAKDMNLADIHTLAGAYALDALTEFERAAFSRHMDGCEACALEVAELQEAATRLTDPTWSVPPPRLRDAVLAEIARTPQSRVGRREDTRSPSAETTRWRRWTAAAVAAGIIAVGASVATWTVSRQAVDRSNRALAAEQARSRQLADLLAEPDARVHTAPVRNGGTLTVVTSTTRNSGMAVLSGLPDPGQDKLYELWFLHGNAATPAGQLAAGQRDGARPVTGLDGATGFAVSVENAPEGARTPTPDQIVGQLSL